MERSIHNTILEKVKSMGYNPIGIKLVLNQLGGFIFETKEESESFMSDPKALTREMLMYVSWFKDESFVKQNTSEIIWINEDGTN